MSICYFWDIETSTILPDGCVYNEVKDERIQVTYLSNVLSFDYITGKIVDSKFFRTIKDTIEYFETLPEGSTVWSHNLDYELTFLLRELGDAEGVIKYNKNGIVEDIYGNISQDLILRDKHSPLSIKLNYLKNITFRDTYALFNKSIKNMGEEIGLPKLDYNYDIVRLPWDDLTELDYKYNQRDNEISAFYLYKYMQDNGLNFENIPLTFTSMVKRKRKEYIVEKFGKKALMKFWFDRNRQIKDFRFFELSLLTYQGGLTASNINQTGRLITEGVYSIDIKSSYPYQMCSRYFPIFEADTTEYYSVDHADTIYKLGNYKGFFGVFKFKNIRVKNRNYLLPISGSQMSKGSVSSDRVVFNGKLMSASDLTLPCNNVDLEAINLVYEYDEIICEELFTTSKQRRLRQEEVSFLLDAFYKKETVKDKNSYYYKMSKIYICSMYGVKVTSPIKNSFSISEGVINEEEYFNFNVDERHEIYDRFIEDEQLFGGTLDIFTDGCYITSYARYMLVNMMTRLVDNGASVIYSDTDSIKFSCNNIVEINSIIQAENWATVKKNKRNIRFKKFKEMENVSDEDYDKITRLGIWEMETVNSNNSPEPLPYFITFGAKKYGYIDNKHNVFTTIAGCNKKNPGIVINNLAKRENIPIEEAFSFVMALGTRFDKTASGRTVAKIETRTREEMDQLTYQGKKINQYGGVIIDKTTYTLNLSFNDSKILDIFRPLEYIISLNIEGEIDYE